MNYAIAGLALVAAATLVNALLTRVVVQAWRATITAPAAAHPHPHEDPGTPRLAVEQGGHLPAFTLHAPDGDVTESALAGQPALIAFLRPNCGPSRESLADIQRWAEANTPAGARLVAVINGQEADAGPLLDAVVPLTGLTATEPPNGPVATAFGVRYHPSFVLLDADGTITETGIGLGSLPALDVVTV
ncbi:peroxiredoxin family protein [Yinghuangia seranimata]|uniref:peroxiredoxin family protein n=1 Tax=Yinghuangia seranimata TaxID=408067 RepID=UPI00248C8015|nr:TlpA disulfide reductase family protein [Yinghuangia seranimata]MDI2128481.1 TlpA disulfide reductase family protein [Yinghuangia seranimata]